MRAIEITKAGGAEVLKPTQRPVPQQALPRCSSRSPRARVTGSGLRASELSLKAEIVRQVKERVWPHLGTKVTPLIDSVMPLDKAAEGHARVESSAHIGKILLHVSD
jgi:NADPH:quinone reductase-like Zn-dependent oxidoreductase